MIQIYQEIRDAVGQAKRELEKEASLTNDALARAMEIAEIYHAGAGARKGWESEQEQTSKTRVRSPGLGQPKEGVEPKPASGSQSCVREGSQV